MAIRPLKNEYRRRPVGNYILFYSVSKEAGLVTVARVIYARREYAKMLK